MLWIKTLHLAALVCWCGALLCVVAGLTQRLPVPAGGSAAAAADAEEGHSDASLRTLFLLIATPSAMMAIVAGTALFPWVPAGETWLAGKLVVVTLLMGLHLIAGWMLLKREAAQQDGARGVSSASVAVLAWLTLAAVLCTLWLVLARPG